MKKFLLFLFTLFFLFSALPVFALDSGLQNNKFGIHLTGSQDVDKAVELVNSNGGDWGYITTVVQETEMDRNRWQEFFDNLREKHLIPLVRIATHPENGAWKKPDLSQLDQWADFLNSLNWPVQNRYVIVYNEPNQTQEWSGTANPKEYAQILDKAITVFKQKSSDFLILNAGFDQAAPNSRSTMDEVKFLETMNSEVPGIFSKLDGWASHAYPNYGFVGKPWQTGRATVKGYDWELEILKKLGVNKDFSVFITETGWPSGERNFYNPEKSAQFIKEAFENVWLPDSKVAAVTPFILNYPAYPFQSFSWLDDKGNPTLQFKEVQDLNKKKGEPPQEEKYEVVSAVLPSLLNPKALFQGKITLINKGQSIWGEKPFKLESQSLGIDLSSLSLPQGVLVKPGEKWTFNYTLKTIDKAGEAIIAWQGLPENKIMIMEDQAMIAKIKIYLNNFVQELLTKNKRLLALLN